MADPTDIGKDGNGCSPFPPSSPPAPGADGAPLGKGTPIALVDDAEGVALTPEQAEFEREMRKRIPHDLVIDGPKYFTSPQEAQVPMGGPPQVAPAHNVIIGQEPQR